MTLVDRQIRMSPEEVPHFLWLHILELFFFHGEDSFPKTSFKSFIVNFIASSSFPKDRKA